ncbi:MAG TPA: hypothetical protein VMH87_02065 [Pseudomonadales bacterium]|nr:hypothetical protein [Pseudomonadales bacterium]
MSDELKQFEKLLESHPLRPVPAEWRKEILAAAEKAQPAHGRQPIPVRSLPGLLRSLFWPHPVAWGGLAAIWIFIFAAHLSMRDEMPVMAEKVLPPSPQVVMELKQQQHLYAELIGVNDSSDTDRPKPFIPKPRSERANIVSV